MVIYSVKNYSHKVFKNLKKNYDVFVSAINIFNIILIYILTSTCINYNQYRYTLNKYFYNYVMYIYSYKIIVNINLIGFYKVYYLKIYIY